jgi:hypothetical protein
LVAVAVTRGLVAVAVTRGLAFTNHLGTGLRLAIVGAGKAQRGRGNRR